MFKDFISTLLQALIVAVVPVLSGFIVKWLNAKAAEIQTRTQNEKAQAYIREVNAAVATAVAHTSQTYVDAVKEKDEFMLDQQKAAAQKAKETALSILSQAARDFIADVYGDVTQFLGAKIEEEVRRQKEGTATLLPGIEIGV